MGNSVSGIRQSVINYASGLGTPEDLNRNSIRAILKNLQEGLSSHKAQQIKGYLSRIYADGNVTDQELKGLTGRVNAANTNIYSDSSQNVGEKAFSKFQELFHAAARGNKFDHNDLARLIPLIEKHRQTLSGSDLEAFDKVVANFKNSWQGGQFDHNGWSRFYEAQGKEADTSGSNTNTSTSGVRAADLFNWYRDLVNNDPTRVDELRKELEKMGVRVN